MLATKGQTSQTVTKSTPSTPSAAQSPAAAVSTPSPGSWQHPKFDEIARRQRLNTFDDGNVQRVIWNGLALLGTVYFFLRPSVNKFLSELSLQNLARPFSIILCLTFLYNISTALRPLYSPKDQLTDIALTPTQRALLGLDPNVLSPNTQGTIYITPPRYARSPISPATSRSASGQNTPNSLKGNYSSPSTRNRDFSNESLYNTPSSSPLWQKSRAVRENIRRRNSSHGTPSPLGPALEGRSVLGAPSTPSPTGGRGGGASVGLNSKWLYERGRSSSGGKSIYS